MCVCACVYVWRKSEEINKKNPCSSFFLWYDWCFSGFGCKHAGLWVLHDTFVIRAGTSKPVPPGPCWTGLHTAAVEISSKSDSTEWKCMCGEKRAAAFILCRRTVQVWKHKAAFPFISPLNSASYRPAQGDGCWLYSFWNGLLLLISPSFSSLCVHHLLHPFVFCPHIFIACSSICWIWLAIVQLSKVLKCSWQLAGWLRPALNREWQVVDRMVCLLSLLSDSHFKYTL